VARSKLGWTDELDRWLQPFMEALGHNTRRRMCPVYVAGLIGRGDRKSVQAMAARAGGVGYDQLHLSVAGFGNAGFARGVGDGRSPAIFAGELDGRSLDGIATRHNADCPYLGWWDGNSDFTFSGSFSEPSPPSCGCGSQRKKFKCRDNVGNNSL